MLIRTIHTLVKNRHQLNLLNDVKINNLKIKELERKLLESKVLIDRINLIFATTLIITIGVSLGGILGHLTFEIFEILNPPTPPKKKTLYFM